MIVGTFDIAIETPKYHRRGTLALKSDGGKIMARLNSGDMNDVEFAGICDGQEFCFEGKGEFPLVGAIDYTAKGKVWGNTVDLTCETSAGKITMFGTRLSTSAGEFKSSHEYMMSVVSGDFTDDGTMYSGLYSDAH